MLGSGPQKGVERKNKEKMGGERVCIIVAWAKAGTHALRWLEAVWDGDSLDWKEISAEEITQRVTAKVQPGSIVLFHNAALHTPEALPGIIEALLQDGYEFVPISELIIQGECGVDYTMDHTAKQCRKQAA